MATTWSASFLRFCSWSCSFDCRIPMLGSHWYVWTRQMSTSLMVPNGHMSAALTQTHDRWMSICTAFLTLKFTHGNPCWQGHCNEGSPPFTSQKLMTGIYLYHQVHKHTRQTRWWSEPAADELHAIYALDIIYLLHMSLTQAIMFLAVCQ